MHTSVALPAAEAVCEQDVYAVLSIAADKVYPGTSEL